ncbi:MAG: hypothetical protein IJT87_01255 [Ruminiclostridium sp.]|nr:hypothetical protein [Ruminiclostridium sp.]
MAKKTKVDVISLSIVILNILIVATLITLVVLITLYMTGKLEDTNVANLDQETAVSAVITTTPITTATPEPDIEVPETTEDTTEPAEDTTAPEDTDNTGDTAETDETEDNVVEAVESDSYDDSFFLNDMFIGDSIYTGLVNYGYFPDRQVFAEIGLNPESARTKKIGGVTVTEKAKKLEPKRIFIMLGSNGLAYMGNTHMAEQLGLLVDELREVCPDSYIYIVSIPPVTKAHDAEGQETMVMVNGYNKLLKSMAEEKGIVYLDLCSKLQDASGYFSADYAEADGLHFLGSAYKAMLSYFQKSIQL